MPYYTALTYFPCSWAQGMTNQSSLMSLWTCHHLKDWKSFRKHTGKWTGRSEDKENRSRLFCFKPVWRRGFNTTEHIMPLFLILWKWQTKGILRKTQTPNRPSYLKTSGGAPIISRSAVCYCANSKEDTSPMGNHSKPSECVLLHLDVSPCRPHTDKGGTAYRD